MRNIVWNFRDPEPTPASKNRFNQFVEAWGHRWAAPGRSHYDPSKGKVVVVEPFATGDEGCEYCGMPYREFSLEVQHALPGIGWELPCPKGKMSNAISDS